MSNNFERVGSIVGLIFIILVVVLFLGFTFTMWFTVVGLDFLNLFIWYSLIFRIRSRRLLRNFPDLAIMSVMEE